MTRNQRLILSAPMAHYHRHSVPPPPLPLLTPPFPDNGTPRAEETPRGTITQPKGRDARITLLKNTTQDARARHCKPPIKAPASTLAAGGPRVKASRGEMSLEGEGCLQVKKSRAGLESEATPQRPTIATIASSHGGDGGKLKGVNITSLFELSSFTRPLTSPAPLTSPMTVIVAIITNPNNTARPRRVQRHARDGSRVSYASTTRRQTNQPREPPKAHVSRAMQGASRAS